MLISLERVSKVVDVDRELLNTPPDKDESNVDSDARVPLNETISPDNVLPKVLGV